MIFAESNVLLRERSGAFRLVCVEVGPVYTNEPLCERGVWYG